MSTKDELDKEVVATNELLNKVISLHLTSNNFNSREQELLIELVEEKIKKVVSEWRQERIEKVVRILFPGYDGRRPENEKPIRHPIKSFWWNGASISDINENYDGSVNVNLTSYTGGGNSDELDDFHILKEWIEADDQETRLHNYCIAITKENNQKANFQALAKAEQDALNAVNTLAELKAKMGVK